MSKASKKTNAPAQSHAPGSEGRKKALEAAVGRIETQFGKGAIMRMDARGLSWPSVSTGSIGLDIALGIGGLPRGRVIEIYGPESSGKTTLALEAVANIQAEDGIAAFVDAEHALDPAYAKKLGCDVDEMLISQPDCGEDALEIASTLVSSGAVDILVIDSVAALTPKAELDGEMGDSQPGLQARLMSQAMRKLTSMIQRTNTTVIFINQIRYKIGVTFGSPETTTGGNALKFYSSVRLDIRRIGSIKDKSGNPVGNQTKVKVAKNKMAPPFQVAEFDIMYGQGVSQTNELIELGVQHGLIEKAGAWFSRNGQRLGQGKEKTAEFLVNNPEIAEEVRAGIMRATGMRGDADQAGDAGDAGAPPAPAEEDA